MARWLAMATNGDGDVLACAVTDNSGVALPFGDHSAICAEMKVDSLDALIELPDEFTPAVYDTTADTEVGMLYLDL